MSFRVGQGACSFLMAGLLVASALVAGHPSHVLKMGPPPLPYGAPSPRKRALSPALTGLFHLRSCPGCVFPDFRASSCLNPFCGRLGAGESGLAQGLPSGIGLLDGHPAGARASASRVAGVALNDAVLHLYESVGEEASPGA